MCNFREEDFLNFSQSESIIGPSRHIGFPNGTKITKNIQNHPSNISTKIGSEWISGLSEIEINVKVLSIYGCRWREQTPSDIKSSPDPKGQVSELKIQNTSLYIHTIWLPEVPGCWNEDLVFSWLVFLLNCLLAQYYKR